MPKMKTFRGAHKRFRLTSKGKVRRNKAMKRHILTKKNRARKRGLRAATTVADCDQRRVKRLIPYA